MTDANVKNALIIISEYSITTYSIFYWRRREPFFSLSVKTDILRRDTVA